MAEFNLSSQFLLLVLSRGFFPRGRRSPFHLFSKIQDVSCIYFDLNESSDKNELYCRGRSFKSNQKVIDVNAIL